MQPGSDVWSWSATYDAAAGADSIAVNSDAANSDFQFLSANE